MKKQVKNTPIKKEVKKAEKQSRRMGVDAISEQDPTQHTSDEPIFRKKEVGDNEYPKTVAYGIRNGEISRKPKVSSNEWANIIGGCLFLLVVTIGALSLFFMGIWEIASWFNIK